jgi:hypothetical protein
MDHICSDFQHDCWKCIKNCIFVYFDMFRQECVNSTLAISGRPQAVLESFCPSMMTSSSPAPVIEHRKESLDFAAIGKLFIILTSLHAFHFIKEKD